MGYIQPRPANLDEALIEARHILGLPPRQMNLARIKVLLEWFVEEMSHQAKPAPKPPMKKNATPKAQPQPVLDDMLKGLE